VIGRAPALPRRPRQSTRPPSRGWRNPADQGPLLEDIDRVIGRAQLAATLEWQVDHGDLPWQWPISSLFEPDDRLREVMGWPQRWFRDHLFELPPLGEVPAPWLWLCS
jgi:hypothetical protein